MEGDNVLSSMSMAIVMLLRKEAVRKGDTGKKNEEDFYGIGFDR